MRTNTNCDKFIKPFKLVNGRQTDYDTDTAENASDFVM